MMLTMVTPLADGMCPVLQPGQGCRDQVHGLYHFCTPDGSRFACNAEEIGRKLVKKLGQEVRESVHGVSILNGPVPTCGRSGLCQENFWTVLNSEWYDMHDKKKA